jgi:hypothetical protein
MAMDNRKEHDNYTLEELEEQERLNEDSKKAEKVNKHMQYIREQSIENLEEWRIEFIKTNHISRENQVFVNQIFSFLKKKA